MSNTESVLDEYKALILKTVINTVDDYYEAVIHAPNGLINRFGYDEFSCEFTVLCENLCEEIGIATSQFISRRLESEENFNDSF